MFLLSPPLRPAPQAVEPAEIAEFGGTELFITVFGAGSAEIAASVEVAGEPCVDVERVNATTIRCVSPPQQQSMSLASNPACARQNQRSHHTTQEL